MECQRCSPKFCLSFEIWAHQQKHFETLRRVTQAHLCKSTFLKTKLSLIVQVHVRGKYRRTASTFTMPRCLVKGTMATTTMQNLWAGWLQQVLELVPLLVLLRELLQVQILDPVQLAQQLVAQAQRVPHQSCFGSTRSCRRRGLQSTHFLHQPHRIQQTLFEDPWTMMEHYGTSFSLTTCPSDLVQMKVCAPAIFQKHISCKSSLQNAVKRVNCERLPQTKR